MFMKPVFPLDLQDLKDAFNSPCWQRFPDLWVKTFSLWRFKVLKTAPVFRRSVTGRKGRLFLVGKTYRHFLVLRSGGLCGNMFKDGFHGTEKCLPITVCEFAMGGLCSTNVHTGN